jgi:hypothetical protein
MKSPTSKHPFHNPFYNRFNDPVTRRREDLQGQAYTLWLKEQNRILPPRDRTSKTIDEAGTNTGLFESRVAGALVLVVVLLISAGVLLKTL